MSKHFCCCIPVRAAVFFFSLLTFLSAGFVAAVSWFAFHEIVTGQTIDSINYGDINTTGRIIVIVFASIFTILTLISLTGFLGSLSRNRRMVKIYSVTLWFQVIAAIVASGFFFYYAYSGKQLYNGCHFKDSDGNEQDCKITLKTWQKIVYTVVVVVNLLLLTYIASVIGRYVDQLTEEHHYDHEYAAAKPTSHSTYTPSYYPQEVQEHHQGLLNPTTGPYPYTDQSHSFGNAAHA